MILATILCAHLAQQEAGSLVEFPSMLFACFFSFLFPSFLPSLFPLFDGAVNRIYAAERKFRTTIVVLEIYRSFSIPGQQQSLQPLETYRTTRTVLLLLVQDFLLSRAAAAWRPRKREEIRSRGCVSSTPEWFFLSLSLPTTHHFETPSSRHKGKIIIQRGLYLYFLERFFSTGWYRVGMRTKAYV